MLSVVLYEMFLIKFRDKFVISIEVLRIFFTSVDLSIKIMTHHLPPLFQERERTVIASKTGINVFPNSVKL